MKLEWINHHNRKILFADFSGLLAPDMIELVDLLFKEVERTPGNVTILSNYSNTSIGPKFVDVSTTWARKLKSKTDRYAVYGLNAPKRIMLNGFNSVTNMGIKAYETKDEALQYLVH